MPTPTLRLHDAQWAHLQEDWRRAWTTLDARAEEFRRSLHDCLRNYFRDAPVPATLLEQILGDYERALLDAGSNPDAAPLKLSDFIRSGPHAASLVENASPPGWSQPEQLRERLAKGWSAAFAQLDEIVEEKRAPGDPLAAYTRSVLERRKARPVPPPVSIYDACFPPSEHVGRLFGTHHDQFLTGHGLSGGEDGEGEGATVPARPPPRPLEDDLADAFRAHLQMTRLLEERRKFWTSSAGALEEFNYLRAPVKLSTRGFKEWLRLLFTSRQRRAELLRELREKHAWAEPPLELVPEDRAHWDALHQRRAETNKDADRLRAAREALDTALARLNVELQRLNDEAQLLSEWKDPPDESEAWEKVRPTIDRADFLCDDTTNICEQITERLASVAQTLSQFRAGLR